LPPYTAVCAEYPNDNPALHRGVTWVCESVLGAPVAVPAEIVSAADDFDDEIEIVDDLDAPRIEPTALEDDRFSTFVRMLVDIVHTSGDGAAADRLTAALASDPTARAWRAIILSESDDFAACGAKTLDEWAADLVAQALTAPSKTEIVRRELRARGVAAFGLVPDAA
jgi:hypothetical protein